MLGPRLRPPTSTRITALFAAVALLVPVALHRLVRSQLAHLAPGQGHRLGIGDLDVTLLGTLVAHDVDVLGVSATAVEATIDLADLAAGTLAAGEIRVSSPRLSLAHRGHGALEIPPPTPAGSGDEHAALLVPAKKGAGATSARPPRFRRLVLTDALITIPFVDKTELSVATIQVQPQEHGLRVVGGTLSVLSRSGPGELRATFRRAGLDVGWPERRLGRAALDGGQISIARDGYPALLLDHAVVTRAVSPEEELRLLAVVHGAGSLEARLARPVDHSATLELEVADLPLAPLAAFLPDWLHAAFARASGSLTAHLDPGADMVATAAGKVNLSGIEITHAVLASRPVPLDGRVDFDLRWDDAARRIAGTVRVEHGPLAVDLAGDLCLARSGGVSSTHVAVELPRTSCAALLATLPPPLLAGLDGLDLDGTLGAHLTVDYDEVHPDDTRFDPAIDLACTVRAEPREADVAALARSFDHVFPDGVTRTMGPAGPGFVSASGLPRHVTGAFLAAEDARFFSHNGFDPVELARSLAIDLATGRALRGGSTISQQLVKNLFLTRERTLARKLAEAVLTWRLEERLAKPRILELYLNLVQLGDGVYGLAAAARHWFAKEPRALSVSEAAFLAALAPAPTATERRLLAAGRLDEQAQRRVHAVLASMLRSRLLDGAGYRRALADRITPRLTK